MNLHKSYHIGSMHLLPKGGIELETDTCLLLERCCHFDNIAYLVRSLYQYALVSHTVSLSQVFVDKPTK